MECEQCTWKDCTVSKGWDTLGSWLLPHISVWSPGWVSLMSLKIYVRTLNLQDRQCRCLWAKGLPWQTLLHCLHASTSDYYCCDVSVGLCRSAFQGLPLLKLWSSIPVFKNYPNLSQTKHLWTEPYQTVQNQIITCFTTQQIQHASWQAFVKGLSTEGKKRTSGHWSLSQPCSFHWWPWQLRTLRNCSGFIHWFLYRLTPSRNLEVCHACQGLVNLHTVKIQQFLRSSSKSNMNYLNPLAIEFVERGYWVCWTRWYVVSYCNDFVE